jgi:hypothetical protein
MTTPEARFTGSGSWAAVGRGQRAARAVLNFKLDLADSGALLERLGSAEVDQGRQGQPVGPGRLARLAARARLRSMTGQFNVAIESGQFLKGQPGAARLLSVLSLQSLPRRLALDFRDVFQEGFAFDNITGDVTINQGVARTNNLRMRGVQAAVLMEGNADIERETQDLRVVVVPEINAGDRVARLCSDQPAIGLGTFLAQVLLRKPLVARRHARVPRDGPWGDPKVDKIERKITDAVPDVDAAVARVRHRADRMAGMKIAALQMVSTPSVERNLAAARPPHRAAARAGAGWSRCPSTSASWARRPRQARDRRNGGRRADPAVRCPTRRATQLWVIGGTVPIRIAGRPSGAQRDLRLRARWRRSSALRQDAPLPLRQRPRALRRRPRAAGRRAAGGFRCGCAASRLEHLLRPAFSRALPRADVCAGERPCDLLAVPAAFTYTTASATGSCCCAPARSRTSAT